MKSRIEQREDLMLEVGLLVDPIRRLVFTEDDPRPKVPFVRSQFRRDRDLFRFRLSPFCKFDEFYFLDTEYDRIQGRLESFCDIFDMVQNPDNWGAKAQEAFDSQLEAVKSEIRRVPCEVPNTIFLANSPFQSYQRLRSMCSTVGSRLDVLDPYLDASVFHRYLAEVPASVPITLITSEDNMTAKRGKHARRRRELVAVSELFAAERPATYRFLVSPSLHDRHLRADSSIYHLGGSIKDAAAKDPFTLSKHASSDTDASLDAIIAGAVEWFGPNTPKHRRR